MTTLRIAWPGWGTFRIEPESGPVVVVDPCMRPLLGNPVASAAQVAADVVLLTHGHHEHIVDAARVAGLCAAPIAAPPQVAAFLAGRRGIPAGRLREMLPDEPLRLPGLRVVPRAFPHLRTHDAKGKLAILGRNRSIPGLLAMALRHGRGVLASRRAIRGQPGGPPYLALDLEFETGPRVLLTCEALTSLLDPREAERWGRGERPIDVAVAGVESGQEATAGLLLDRLAPWQALAAAVHAPFERFYGHPPVSARRLLGSTRVPCRFLAPGDMVTLDLPGPGGPGGATAESQGPGRRPEAMGGRPPEVPSVSSLRSPASSLAEDFVRGAGGPVTRH